MKIVVCVWVDTFLADATAPPLPLQTYQDQATILARAITRSRPILEIGEILFVSLFLLLFFLISF